MNWENDLGHQAAREVQRLQKRNCSKKVADNRPCQDSNLESPDP